ncbi:MAG: NAD-dependent epimerase/dehydratase family protein [Chloroflexi bacterium]|nr:NAD-dependent epimerase/dehydratase family protein [Chloroflexota bacterium]
MNLLILGGTVFLGRHLVDAALARGHAVTLFNRGQHNPELFPNIVKLRGNRDGDLAVLEGRRWDAVIDTCGFIPRIVRASAEMLADRVDHYTFISSISALADFSPRGLDESAPVAQLKDGDSLEKVTEGSYGPLKALCEQAVEQAMAHRTLVLRPGLIVGPHDPTDRFTYWPHRIARGGEVLAPGDPNRLVQIIDARDLAEWNIRMVEQKRTGIFNATGPADTLTMGQMLEDSRRVSGSDARITWVDEQFLLDAGVGAWIEVPLWIPEKENEGGLMAINCRKAIAAGLTFRPLADTIRDTLAWDATRPADVARRAGMKRERETELQVMWHKQKAPL